MVSQVFTNSLVYRALYSDSDVYFLDDPLSAVDVHVGKHLFHNAIRGGHMKDAAVLLVTHQTHFLPFVDKILVLEGGKIEFYGTYNEMKEKEKDIFTRLGLNDLDVNELSKEREREREEACDAKVDSKDVQGVATESIKPTGTFL